MALSEDQKALLRLLAQGDVSIEDIAALKGKSVEQVQAEVSAALGESKREDGPPAPKPVEEEPPAPQPDPEPEPEKPAPKPPKPSRPRKPAAPRAQRTRASVPPERRRFLAIAGGALALIAIVLGAIALFGDNDSGSSGSATLTGVEDDRVTQAVLTPPDGGDASGNAVFGRVGQREVVLQLTAEGLEPTADGESYAIWLYRTPKLSLRIGAVKAEEGEIAARFPVPAEVLAYVGGGAFDQIYVSRTSDAEYKREVAQARKGDRLPSYSGETVLTGEIVGPLAEAAEEAAAAAKNGNSGNAAE